MLAARAHKAMSERQLRLLNYLADLDEAYEAGDYHCTADEMRAWMRKVGEAIAQDKEVW